MSEDKDRREMQRQITVLFWDNDLNSLPSVAIVGNPPSALVPDGARFFRIEPLSDSGSRHE